MQEYPSPDSKRYYYGSSCLPSPLHGVRKGVRVLTVVLERTGSTKIPPQHHSETMQRRV